MATTKLRSVCRHSLAFYRFIGISDATGEERAVYCCTVDNRFTDRLATDEDRELERQMAGGSRAELVMTGKDA